MSNIVNLQRDGLWMDFTGVPLTWSAAVAISGGTYNSNSDAAVYDTVGKAYANYPVTALMVADSFRGIGVWMKPPGLDAVPYRVRIDCSSIEGDHRFYLGMGFPAAGITGTDDSVASAHFFGIGVDRQFDSLIMVDPLESTDPNYGVPINFSVVVADNALSNAHIFAQISVQNLSTAPPQFAQSCS